MQKFFFIIIATLLCAPAPLFAEMECNKKLSNSIAKERLTRVQQAYSSLSSFKSRFKQKGYLAALDFTEISSGNVYFLKPGKMRWHYLEPEEQLFIVNQGTFWLYQKTEAQVVISELKKILISELPVSFILGVGDLARDFEISSACRYQDEIKFTLTPKEEKASASAELKILELLVDVKSNYPRGAVIRDDSGNRTEIHFTEFEENISLTPDLFSADFPKGVDIVDKRAELPQ